jgi:hypothetical protein
MSDRRAIALVVGVIAIVWLLAHVPAAQSYVTPQWTVPPSAVMPITGPTKVPESVSGYQLPSPTPRPTQPLSSAETKGGTSSDARLATTDNRRPATTPPAQRASGSGAHSLAELTATGTASWYDNGSGYYAALPGPWRAGRTVTVCGPAQCVTAPVVTSCVCGTHVIDLSPSLWERVAGMSTAERWKFGVVSVSIVIEGGKP